MRTRLVVLALLLAAMCAVPFGAGPVLAGELGERAREINQQALVFDAHCDTVMRILEQGVDLGVRSDEGHIDIPRAREGGLNVQVFAMWVEPDFWPHRAAFRTLRYTDAMYRTIEKHSDKLGLALTVRDARRLVKQGKLAVFLGIEGGHAIEDSLATLRMFHRLGVRVMTLTWWNNTNWADGSGDKPKHHGLTEFGEQVVREMNRLGMVIDVSHVSDETFYDVLRVTTKPVMASHSCTRSICKHHRNLSDKMLKALAKNGGVIGINYYLGFLDPEVSRQEEKRWKALEPRLQELNRKYKNDRKTLTEKRRELYRSHQRKPIRVPIDRLIEHIDHVVKVAGVDHVGLGSDFDGCSITPTGLDDVSDLPLITEKLLEGGYSQEDIRKILGGNLLRVFEAALGE
jgi:membrane dipeptidase